MPSSVLPKAVFSNANIYDIHVTIHQSSESDAVRECWHRACGQQLLTPTSFDATVMYSPPLRAGWIQFLAFLMSRTQQKVMGCHFCDYVAKNCDSLSLAVPRTHEAK